MLLDKTTLLKPSIPKIEKVSHPDGGHVFVRVLPLTDVDDYEAENYVVDTNGKVTYNRRNLRARLLVRAVCDDKGTPIFSPKDVDAIGKRSDKFFDECYRAALRLNGLSGREDVERAEKNSDTAPGESSALP